MNSETRGVEFGGNAATSYGADSDRMVSKVRDDATVSTSVRTEASDADPCEQMRR